MKSLSFLVVFSLCFLISCDKAPADTTQPNAKEQSSNPSKINNTATKIPPPRQPQKSALVESETQVPEKPVNDAGVDYDTFSKAVCACAAKSNELNNTMQSYSESGNSQAFTEMVPKVSAAYDRSVACAKGQAEAVNSEYSMQKLIKAMKGNCGSYHDKLIWQIFLALKNG